MAKSGLTCRVRVHRAWWLRWYLCGVTLASLLTGRDPDWVKVEGWVRRGLKVKLETE